MPRFWLVPALLLGAACGTTEPDLCASAPTYTNDIYPIVQTRCLQCHSTTVPPAQRNGAPLNMDFDTYESTMPFFDQFSNAITTGTEPPTGTPGTLGTTAPERATVDKWRSCMYQR